MRKIQFLLEAGDRDGKRGQNDEEDDRDDEGRCVLLTDVQQDFGTVAWVEHQDAGLEKHEGRIAMVVTLK